MDNRDEVRDFLMTRRARLSPDRVGISSGSNRRVPGLRRAEIAALAGLSVEYYAKLERGMIAGASPAVLDAIARALRLDNTERAHLLDLVRAADGTSTPGRRPSGSGATRPGLQLTLDAITGGIASVRNRRHDLLATNALARAFYAPVIGCGGGVPNLARFQFLDPAARDFYPDWDRLAELCVAIMRAEAGRAPHDLGLRDVVDELSTRSEVFRRLWDGHDVRAHGAGVKRFCHPAVGELVLGYEELAVTAEPGLILMVYTAEPGSASAERLGLLGSLAAAGASVSADHAD